MLEIAPLLWKRQWSPTIPRTSTILHQIDHFPISPGNPPVHAPGFPRLQYSPSRCPPAQQSSPRGQGWFMEGQRWQPEHTQPLAPLSRHPKLQLPPASWIFSCKKKDFSQCLLKVSTEWSISPKWCSMNVNGTCDCQWEALHTGSQWRKDKAPWWWSIWFHLWWWSSCLFVGLFVLFTARFIYFFCLFICIFVCIWNVFYGFQLLEMNLDILSRAESKLQKRSRLMVSIGLNVNIHLMSSSKIGQFLCSAYLTLFDEISQTGEPYLYLIHVPMGSDHWCMKLCKTPCWRLCWDI